ncbi:MAG: hypothetical protein M3P27_05420 [Acidobacteriota bacterium]|nr:hypothetical protein [Acidobacteriota bacterium]
MRFQTIGEVYERLKGPEPLNEAEVRGMLPFLGVLNAEATRRIEADLALQTISAVRGFDRSSQRLSRWLLWLTVAIAVMTAAIGVMTAVQTYFHINR